MQKFFKFDGVYTKSGWLTPGYIHLDAHGQIKYLNNQPNENTHYLKKYGFLIPGFVNAHSHSFQFAMAGMTENNCKQKDDFWTWRQKMYELVNTLTPESLYSISKSAYDRLLQYGYTNVVEFHYIHHQPGGKPYDQNTILGEQILRAANDSKIQVTLVPILYQKSYFDKDAESHQLRFIYRDLDLFLRYSDDLKALSKIYGQNFAIGFHSLRAVEVNAIQELLKIQNLPIHFHCSEQIKETSDFISLFRMRPLEWLDTNCNLSSNHNLIHCTQTNEFELSIIAKSNANVVLCPSTEGNLGDGIFKAHKFAALNGRWTIGTDSYSGINPCEELRWLEYCQRMLFNQRNLLAKDGIESGDYLYNQATKNGYLSAGVNYAIELNNPIYGIHIRTNQNISKEKLLSHIIFGADYKEYLKAAFIKQHEILLGQSPDTER